MLSPAGCMWLCLCGERLWSSLYLVIKESLWQKPNIRRDELWTKELWQFQVMWFLCPFFFFFCQMKNQYIFRVIHIQRVHRASALIERGEGGLWARVGTVACSPVITVPSHFPTHWWIFQSWCDCPSWQLWCFFFSFSFFSRHPFSFPRTLSTHPNSAGSFWIGAAIVVWARGKRKKMH